MNMTRILFALLASGGCAMIGLTMARRLTRREETIAAWLRLMDALAAQLSYVDDPLPDVLLRIVSSDTPADDHLSKIIQNAAELMRMNRTLPFGRAIDTEAAFDQLESSDAAALMPLIRDLGATARTEQILRIKSVRESLSALAIHAADRTNKQRRLYVSLGTLGGLALFLVLI